jgi:subtilisin family serine protease
MGSKDSRRKARVRNRSIERLEDRCVFSANPIDGSLVHHASPDADFWIDTSLERNLGALVGDIEKTLSSAHNSTGLTGVRNDYGFTGAGQTVAVIDSGIAWNHSALGNGLGSSYRVVGGWDFTENDANPYDDGPEGSHGTHVAGIIGADTTGTTNDGVAPGVDLVGLRVFDDAGAGYFSWVESALQWVHQNRNAFENPITAVNLSLGTSWNSASIPNWAMLEDEFAQLKADGIFIAVSAGNSFASYNAPGLSYPAASPHVVPVMSVMDNGNLSSFSQRHTRAIGAPGQYIVSTVPDYVGNNNGVNDDWASFSGTSMASPYVAASSVLLRQAMEFVGWQYITQDVIYSHMMYSAKSFFDSATGQTYKRIDLATAFNTLMPIDEYGSTASTAHGLGTLGGNRQINGVISKLSDADYFQFTAAGSGTATFQISTTHSLAPQWSGAGGSASGNTYAFQVVAGQSYTVGLSTGNGIGWYGINVTAPGAAVQNSAPVLATIGNRSIAEGNQLTFTASATDVNTNQSLTYTLGSGAPAGATINATTGVFSWAPTSSGTYNVTLVVTDNGTPALSDSETFTITVDDDNQWTPEYVRYLSLSNSGWLASCDNTWQYAAHADIVMLGITGGWHDYSMYFNGADVGLTTSGEGVDAFTFLSDGSILISTSGSYSISTNYNSAGSGSGATLSGGGEDILRFTPTTVGDNTTGTWSIYLDGSDVGLSGSSENIDAISVLNDGRIVVSTSGSASASGVNGDDKDLLAFSPTMLGATSRGSWSVYLDSSDVGLTTSDEDIDALFIDQSRGVPDVYTSTRGNYSVTGNSGGREDGFAFRPTQLGSTTSGSFMPYYVLDGGWYGLGNYGIDGFYFGSAPGPTPGSFANQSATEDVRAGSYRAAFDEMASTALASSLQFGSGFETVASPAAYSVARHIEHAASYKAPRFESMPQGSVAPEQAIAVDRVDAWTPAGFDFDEVLSEALHSEVEAGVLHAVDHLFSLAGNAG